MYDKFKNTLGIIGIILAGCIYLSASDASAAGPTQIIQHITATTTWTRANSPYVIPQGYLIQINAPLIIEPGVVVKIKPYHWMSYTSGVVVNGPVGKIIAQGTIEEPIIFTSYYDHDYAPEVGGTDNPAKGDWRNLKFSNDDSILDNVLVRYGGNIRYVSNSLEFTNSSRAQMTNSIVESSAWRGIDVLYNASPIFDSLTLGNNNNTAFFAGYGAGPGVLQNSTIEANGSSALYEVDANSQFRFQNNINNNPNARYVKWTGSASRDVVWHNHGLPYLNMPAVESGATVRIEPGTVFKFEAIPNLFKRGLVRGVLNAAGDENNPIVFTSMKDDTVGGDTNGDGSATSPAPRDWGELAFENTPATSTLDYVEIRYGGEFHGDFSGAMYTTNHTDTVYLKNAKLAVSNSKITDGGLTGIFATTGGRLSVRNSDINGHKTGIFVNWDAASADLKNNSIFGNLNYGLQNTAGFQIDATNTWWGNDTGPTVSTNPTGTGDKITGNILYDPWAGKIKKKIPVIIVPGIISSYLNDKITGEEVWPNFEKMIAPYDYYLDILQLDEFQKQINYSINPTDIFRSIEDKDFFAGLIQELKNNGYEEGKDMFVFPYDWRLNIDWTAGDSPLAWQETLKQKIENVKASTSASKVDIIAHSMGGLVVKSYINKYTNANINKFIDIATPHLGSPSAFKILEFGDNFDICPYGICILNKAEVKKISQNMSSVYQLLPSRKYFESDLPQASRGYIAMPTPNKNYNIFDRSTHATWNSLSYDESIDYVANVNNIRTYTGNQFLLGKEGTDAINVNDELHNKLDNLPESDNYYNIIGCGQDTYAGVKITNKLKPSNLIPVKGDGTVPLQSAMPFGAKKYFIASSSHPFLPSLDGVRQLVRSILEGKEDDFNLAGYNYIGKHPSICGSVSGVQVGNHSPVKLHAYDEKGNHTGPTENGDIEEGIPGAYYDVYDEDQYVWLPAGRNYQIVSQATSSGLLGITIEKVENSEKTKFVYFDSIKLSSASTSVVYDISDVQTEYKAILNPDGSGLKNQTLIPSSILSGSSMDDASTPSTTIDITGQFGNNGYCISNVDIELTAQDNLDGAGILKTEYSLDNGYSWNLYDNNITISDDGEYNIIYTSTDKAGNREENQEMTVRIDKTEAIISNTFLESQHILNSPPVLFDFDGHDDGSGLKFVSAILDGSDLNDGEYISFIKPGYHKIVITAEDNAGNIAIKTIDFQVFYSFSGFLSPVNINSNTVYKLGRTIPIKFSLLDVMNRYISNAIAKLSMVFINNDVVDAEVVAPFASEMDTGSIFRYDPIQNQYVYNLSTNLFSVGKWWLKVNLDDDITHSVFISFRN